MRDGEQSEDSRFAEERFEIACAVIDVHNPEAVVPFLIEHKVIIEPYDPP